MPQAFTIFEEERINLGEKVLSRNYAPLAQEFLKKGCPRCLRARIWSLLLGSEVKQYVSENILTILWLYFSPDF